MYSLFNYFVFLKIAYLHLHMRFSIFLDITVSSLLLKLHLNNGLAREITNCAMNVKIEK